MLGYQRVVLMGFGACMTVCGQQMCIFPSVRFGPLVSSGAVHRSFQWTFRKETIIETLNQTMIINTSKQ